MQPTMNLPDNRKTFEISIKGNVSGQMWAGKFECVCAPNLRQRSQASVFEKQLGGDLKTLDEDMTLYHRLVSQLSVRILAAPDWWIASNNGQELLDINVLFEIWRQCAQAEGEWKTKVWGEPEKKAEVESTDEKSAEK